MKAAHIDRARSRHIMKNPASGTSAEITAMGAEIERLHARLRLMRATPITIGTTVINVRAGMSTEEVLDLFRRELEKAALRSPAQASTPADGESKEGIASGVPGGGET